MSETTVADALSQLRSIREFHGTDLSVTTKAVMDALEALAREKADAESPREMTLTDRARLEAAEEDVADMSNSMRNAIARAEALEKFKAYVHQRLDEAGVPTHPNGPHSVQGCRIGDRLDLLLRVPRTCTIHIPGHPACDGGPTCSQQAAEAAETWTPAKARRLEQAEADLADASVSLRAALRRAEAAEKANAAERKERDDALQQLVTLETQLTLSDGELKAAEKERDEAKTAKIFLAAKLDDTHTHRCWHCENTVTEATSTRQRTELDLAHQDRDALRADCERLSKLHEQDKVELVRWRKAAAELRNLFGTDKPMGSPHYYAEDFVRLHLRATLKDAEKP